MKRVLFVSGLLALGSLQTLSAQDYMDDRYSIQAPSQVTTSSEDTYTNTDGQTSYLSYEDEVSYTSRIKRFQRPMVSVGYWSGMYDPFWDLGYYGYPGSIYRPWGGISLGWGWGWNSFYSPYSAWGWSNPYWGWGYSNWGWGYPYGFHHHHYWGSPYWGGSRYGYGLGYYREPTRNTRSITNGPRRTTVGERSTGTSNIRYNNGFRTRSTDIIAPNSRQNDRRVPEITPRTNDRVTPRQDRTTPRMNNNSYQPSRNFDSQPSRNINSQPSRNFNSTPSRSSGGSNFSAPSRSGGRGR